MPGRKLAAVVPQRNKPYKHSTKKRSSLKSTTTTSRANRRVPATKDARKQRTADRRKLKVNASRALEPSAAPRLLALIPLQASIPIEDWIESFLRFIFTDLVKNKILDTANASIDFEKCRIRLLAGEITQIPLPSWCRESRHIQLILARRLENQPPLASICLILDICKAADVVIPIYGKTTCEDAGFDSFSNELFSLLQKQGISAAAGVSIDPDSASLATRSFETSFGRECRFFPMNLKQVTRITMVNFVRHIATVTITPLQWRESKRGYALINSADIKFESDDGKALVVRGFVRGVGIAVKTPIHITNVGDFALTQIDVIPMRGRVADFAEPVMISKLEQTDRYAKAWPSLQKPDDLPPSIDKGSGAELNDEDVVDEKMEEEEDCSIDFAEYDQSALVKGDLRLRERADMEFADEVDTPNDISARDRFRKYRGLKSFKNSNWDNLAEDENQMMAMMAKLSPYRKQLDTLANHYLTELKTTTELARTTVGGEWAYQLRLSLEFDEGDWAQKISALRELMAKQKVILISTISFFERKSSIQHYGMTSFGDSLNLIVPSKSCILMQCGFRRQLIRPIFSSALRSSTSLVNNLGSQKLAVQRYLNQGIWDSVDDRATNRAIAPLTIFSAVASSCQFENDPCLAWFCGLESEVKRTQEIVGFQKKYAFLTTPFSGVSIASGKFLKTDPDKLLIKRILLTGYPHKISGRRATVIRMFMNRQDVEYFSRISLSTAKGKTGKIVEPLGMHGAMKCYFEEPVDHAETICLPLYRRVYPPLDERSLQPFRLGHPNAF